MVYLFVKFTFGKSWELLGEPGESVFILFFFFFSLSLSVFALHYIERSKTSSTDAIGGQYRRRLFFGWESWVICYEILEMDIGNVHKLVAP